MILPACKAATTVPGATSSVMIRSISGGRANTLKAMPSNLLGQRAARRGALQRQRSLWSLSAAELYAMVEELERFPDAAAGQAFPEVQGGEGGGKVAD